MASPMLTYETSIPLQRAGDCSLLGVGRGPTIYAEVIYGDGWLAQYALAADGSLLAFVDEQDGGQTLQPLVLPPDVARPQPGWHTMRLNFSGPRHRGLAGPERLLDLVQPLGMADKMRLIEQYRLPLTPPQLAGLAESYVLAEAALVFPDVFVITRRIRLAYRTDGEQLGDDQQPYDYDTLALYLAEIVDRRAERAHLLPLGDDLLPGATLHRPMDCIVSGDMLVVADGGDGDQCCMVHVWRIERPDATATADQTTRKLYG